MTVGEQADEQGVNKMRLADQYLANLFAHPVQGAEGLVNFTGEDSEEGGMVKAGGRERREGTVAFRMVIEGNEPASGGVPGPSLGWAASRSTSGYGEFGPIPAAGRKPGRWVSMVQRAALSSSAAETENPIWASA